MTCDAGRAGRRGGPGTTRGGPPRRRSPTRVPGKLHSVDNDLSRPSLGHVVVFAAVTVGWLVLLLITLMSSAPGPTLWIKVGFSGLFAVISGVGTALLWRRVSRDRNQ